VLRFASSAGSLGTVEVRMTHPEHTHENLEALTLYALDLLEDHERAALEEHLNSGCAFCESQLMQSREEVACLIANGVPIVEPPAGLRSRVLAIADARPASGDPVQIGQDSDGPRTGEAHVVRSGEGVWNEMQPGISVKKLYVDRERGTVSMLIRMSPGASYGRHFHAGAEQFLLLEGDLREGEKVMTAGDYQWLPAGSTHGRQSTETGCLVFVVRSLHDQMLE
jgi:anti-sigma factor ChrR (cupin superfamily)